MPVTDNFYILEEQNPVPCADILRWAEWMESDGVQQRIVAKTVLAERDKNGKEVEVSTVFLGIDHSSSFEDSKQLFETMVCGGMKDGFVQRYATWEEAEAGHQQIVSTMSNQKMCKDAIE